MDSTSACGRDRLHAKQRMKTIVRQGQHHFGEPFTLLGNKGGKAETLLLCHDCCLILVFKIKIFCMFKIFQNNPTPIDV